MRGAIIGDVIGSAFINMPESEEKIQLLNPNSAFTPNSIFSLAIADAILTHQSFETALKTWISRYPAAGFSSAYLDWAYSVKPYDRSNDQQSDGVAQRAIPIGYYGYSLDEVLDKARQAAIITHPTEAAIHAAQAVAASIFMAKQGYSMLQIKTFLRNHLNYVIDEHTDKRQMKSIVNYYESVAPLAFMLFFVSTDYEDAIRRAIAIGGPTNTISCITGALAHAFHRHIPKCLIRKVTPRLVNEMDYIVRKFEAFYFNRYIQLGQRALNLEY